MSLLSEVALAESFESTSAIRVRVATATPTEVGSTSIATGVVHAFRKATVAAQVPGQITTRLVEPGKHAKLGELLVRIDSNRTELALKQAQAMADARRVDAEHARHEHLRSQRLYKKKVVSQDTVDDLRFAERVAVAQFQAAQVAVASAKRNFDDTQVKAPFAGQIEQVHVQVGDYVNPGQPIITQTDFTQARLIAGVNSRESNLIHQNDAATVIFEDLGGLAVSAQVTSVGRIKDPASGTYPVELSLSDPLVTQRLREGMIASVSWSRGDADNDKLAVPSSAIFRKNGRIYVYAIDEQHAKLVEVRIGASNATHVEILSGLDDGQMVVTQGQFALRDGALVAFDEALQG